MNIKIENGLNLYSDNGYNNLDIIEFKKEICVVKMKFVSRKCKKVVLKLLLFSVIVYIVCLFVNQQIKIKTKEEELSRLNNQIVVEKNKSEDIRNKIRNAGESINPNGGKSGRRVFENVAE